MKNFIITILIILLYSNLIAQKKEYNEGLKSLNAKNFEEAIKWFTESIILDPSNADAYQKRGKAQCLLGNYDKAEMDLDECLNRDESCEARFWKGFVYEKQGQYDLAVKQFKKSCFSGPYSYFHLGICYYQLSNYKEALYNLDMAIFNKEDKDLGSAYTYRGLCFIAQNKTDQACIEFREAKLNNDPNADNYLAQYCITNSNDITIAESYYQEGESLEKDLYFKAAIDKYLKAVEYYPDYDKAYYKLAINYDKLLNYDDDPRWESDLVLDSKVNPLNYINRAISIKNYLNYYAIRGTIYMKLCSNILYKYHKESCYACGDLVDKYFDLAKVDFNTILKKDSTYYPSYSNIAWLYYDDYKYENAIDYFLKALLIFKEKEKKSFDIDIYMGLALSLFYRDRTNERTKNQYYNEIKSNRPEILTGEEGVKTLIKEGYYYSKKQKQDFVNMIAYLKNK